jgi:hypothetical protein
VRCFQEAILESKKRVFTRQIGEVYCIPFSFHIPASNVYEYHRACSSSKAAASFSSARYSSKGVAAVFKLKSVDWVECISEP